MQSSENTKRKFQEYNLAQLLEATNVKEYKITPTISHFNGDILIMIHIWGINRNDSEPTIISIDLLPYKKALPEDLLRIPTSISNVHFHIPYSKEIDRLGETFIREYQYVWTSYSDENGNSVELSGDSIEYNDELEYKLSLCTSQRELERFYLFFDTETTGLPQKSKYDSHGEYIWPRLVQISWILTDWIGKERFRDSFIIKPAGFVISSESEIVHGISTQKALLDGKPLSWVLSKFIHAISLADVVVGHNLQYDAGVIKSEYKHLGKKAFDFNEKECVCTMRTSAEYYGESFPSLQNLYTKLFGHSFQGAHNAISDAEATMMCFWRMKKTGILNKNNKPDNATERSNWDYEQSPDLPF